MKKKRIIIAVAVLFLATLAYSQFKAKWIEGEFESVLKFAKQVLFKELAAAPSATTSYGTLYVKSSDGLPYFKTSAGVEHGLAVAVSIGDYIDLPEISEPGTPDSTELRLWVEDFHGYSLYSYKDDAGMVRRIGDNVYIGVNNTVSTIPANTAVYAAGNDLDPLPAAVELAPAKADSATTMPCIGVTIESIAAGAYGRYMVTGLIEDVNTSAFSVGDTLWVSATSAGGFTATKPVYPNIPQEMGTILVDHASLGAAIIVARGVGTGIIIGTDAQAWDAGLDSLAALTYASDSFIKVTATDTYAIRTLSETAADLEASIEAAIDTLANLTSVQGHTLTLAGNLVTQNNNVTINAVTAARTLTLNESLTIGDGNDGTITFSGARIR